MGKQCQLTIYLDETQLRAIKGSAIASGKSVNAVIRDAIDQVFSKPPETLDKLLGLDKSRDELLVSELRWIAFATSAGLKYHPAKDLLPSVLEDFNRTFGENRREP